MRQHSLAEEGEEAPMLPGVEASDEEQAQPPSQHKPNRYYNRTQAIMWRIIWVLAATSVLVIFIFAPWPDSRKATQSSPAKLEDEAQDEEGSSDKGMHSGGMHGDMSDMSDCPCCNSTSAGSCMSGSDKDVVEVHHSPTAMAQHMRMPINAEDGQQHS